MIIGIGVDIVQISRFIPWTKNRKLAARFFSEKELAYTEMRPNAAQSLAVRFAAKEAFGKALGSGLRNITLKDIQVEQDELGRPLLVLHGSARRMMQEAGADAAHISISHDGEYGLAYVILESTPNGGKEQ